jgi:RND family efflux transporter MFP subunit
LVEDTPVLPKVSSEAKTGGARTGRAKTRVAGFVLLGVIAAALIAGVLPRLERRAVLSAEAKTLATERLPVHVTEVKAGEAKSEFTLPGSTEAIVEAPIYARTSGYITRRLADIGDKEKAGAVLAEIDAPELDQELMQARASVAHAEATLGQTKASLVQAQAKMTLAKATLERWSTLMTRGVVSHQEKDEKQGDYDGASAEVDALRSSVVAAETDVEAQKANVRRLEELTSFKQVRAPFDGVITARHIDVGNLITGGSGSSQQELYHMAKTDELRIMVDVPQTYSPLIQVGDPAVVRIAEFGQREFPGKVVRTADSLNPSSRTLLTEVHIPNVQHLLFPGMFSYVRFKLQTTAPSMIVPANVLVVDARGTQVVVVDDANTVHFAKVILGRDYGATVEVLSGVRAGERVVANPGDGLAEGTKVEVLQK